MTAPRTDFVISPRPAYQELRIHGYAYEVLHRLVMEADYRTGFVHGSERTIADLFGLERKTYHRAAAELEGVHIRTTKANNQHDRDAGVLVLNYRSLAMRPRKSAGPHLSPADESAGPSAGPSGGPYMAPARATDLQERGIERGDKTQDSVLPAHSLVQSLSHSFRADAKTAPSEIDERPISWASTDEEIEHKRSLARLLEPEGQELRRRNNGKGKTDA